MIQDTDCKHPVVTFALFAFNQEKYIRDAVLGALSQTYEPLEIILSDDCSTDRSFEIMQDVVSSYEGNHRVSVRRNRQNLGLAAHINSVLMDSNGQIVVLAAGDDVSLPERTAESVELLCKNPTATSVLMSGDVINEDGRVVSEKIISKNKNAESVQCLNDLLSWTHVTFGACRAFRKELFKVFGPLREDCPTEDTPLLLRSLIMGDNILSPKKGVLYRRHDNNLSGVESLISMKIEKIYDQYESDLSKAAELGLLNFSEVKSIRSWMKSDLRARIVSLRSLSGSRLSLSDCFFIFRHPKFDIKQTLLLFFKNMKLVK
ncbi:Glycosyl transferase family 2 [Marinobacter sp. DSM 26671]|uniref:glycosyltransferase n=1 Tax=Marinobacter sp. DSM 26671 TaxID=1761793 RepID=UPI0008E290E4|nr:glycosyltransferase [Marinobacter sp. DSM 26671]SFD95918.1 Glycosyl transferase family 2 [Marinobacter sp. DSM 26671]